MKTEEPQGVRPSDSRGPRSSADRTKNCLVTVILLQVNYVNNSGTYPVTAKFHCNVEGYDVDCSRELKSGGTVDPLLWYREQRHDRCETDVEISFVMDVSLSPRAETSPLDAHLSEMRTYKCPSYKDHEAFKLTVGDPNDSHITFDFVFRVTLECRDTKRKWL